MKKQKGITLVALVITIIILLILAGITIAQLTGNGLFENAKLAKEKYANSQEKEDKILSDYESLIGGSYRDNKEYDPKIYDEWTTWLYLAGIENPKQYNKGKIVENENLMKKVLNNDSAVEYMLQSTDFIMPAICTSETAIDYIVKNESVRNKVLKDNSWVKVIEQNGFMSKFDEVMIKVPVSTTVTENMVYSSMISYVSGYEPNYAFDGVVPKEGGGTGISWLAEPSEEDSYIGYKFNEPVSLYKFSMTSNFDNVSSNVLTFSFVLQGLNQDGTWENIGNEYVTDFEKKLIYVTRDYYINSDKKYYGFRIKNNYSSSGNGEKCWHVHNVSGIRIGELQFYCVK